MDIYGHFKSECRAPGGGAHQQAKEQMESEGSAKFVDLWNDRMITCDCVKIHGLEMLVLLSCDVLI